MFLVDSMEEKYKEGQLPVSGNHHLAHIQKVDGFIPAALRNA